VPKVVGSIPTAPTNHPMLRMTERFREAAEGGNKKKGASRVAPLARVKHIIKFDFQAFLSFDQLQARINSTTIRQLSGDATGTTTCPYSRAPVIGT
jgi:hypothetical protein